MLCAFCYNSMKILKFKNELVKAIPCLFHKLYTSEQLIKTKNN